MKRFLRLGMGPAVLTLLCSATGFAQGTLQYLAQFVGDRGEPQAGLTPGPGGLLYGTAKRGGHGFGSVFRIDPASATPTLTTVYAFSGGLDGLYPTSRLLLASDGNFYGTTTEGGPGAWGTVFKLTPAGALTTLASFSFGDPNGYEPVAGLVEASDGNFYGTTPSGGAYGSGTVFRVAPSGGVVLVHAFNSEVDGGYLNGALVEGSDGALYGTTASGGPGGSWVTWGTIFKLNPGSGGVTTLWSFGGPSSAGGSEPYGTLVRGAGGVFFGATFTGGVNDGGTVFRITEAGALTTIASPPTNSNCDVTLGSDGNIYLMGGNGNVYKITPGGVATVIATFAAEGGARANLRGPLLETSTGTFYGVAPSIGSHNQGAVFRLVPNPTPVVTILDSFGAAGGANPFTLIRASAGGFYGATSMGGASAYGTVFRLTAGGALTTVRSFAFGDISDLPPPFETLGLGIRSVIEGTDGNLYGTTSGTSNSGTVFKLTPGGALTTLSGASNGLPVGSVVEASDGNLYGMKYGFPHSVFKLTRDGTFTEVASWGSGGLGHPIGRLTLGRDGNFYGMTAYDGPTFPYGRIFKVTPAGVLTTFASFTRANAEPFGPLVAAPDGNLYGRTRYDASGTIGTVFRVTPAGVLTTVALVNGSLLSPSFDSDLTLGPDGNLYGTTFNTIFRLTPAGTLTTLRTFSPSEGAFLVSLVVTGSRELYGVAYGGGPLGGGSVFHLTDVAPLLTSVNALSSPLVTLQSTVVSGAVTATDSDDTTLVFRIVSQGAKGTAVVNATTGAFTYTPAPGARGRDAFTVKVSDPFGDSNVVTVFVMITPLGSAPRDVDGDGRADITVYDATSGQWRTLTSTSGYATPLTTNRGGAGYTPVPGDYDGDGLQDVAIYNDTTGVWSIVKSSGGSLGVTWGGPLYRPVQGDYDGDGKTDLGVYRVSNAQWSVLLSSSNYTTTVSAYWGGGGYVPVPGQDFDGDGKTDVAVYSQWASTWYVLESSTNYTTSFSQAWGGVGYTLVPGDYDGDGKADLGVYRRSTGTWSVLLSGANFTTAISQDWGGIGYFPVAADFDGDGKIDLGAIQQATGHWYVLLSGAGFTTSMSATAWGTTADQIISTTIVPAAGDLSHATDFDADGKADITVYNPTSGGWSSLLSTGNHLNTLNGLWGSGNGYTAAPGDYDGDGRTDLGVYENATGNWTVLLSGDGFTTALNMTVGGAAWAPMPGDYDGDGKTDFAVYNATTAQWFGLKSSTNYTTSVVATYGGAGYTPVTGDFDGDGKTDLGVYQSSTGDWSVLLAAANYTTSLNQTVGGPGDIPVPADYDGDGKTDFVVYNPTTGLWHGLKSSTDYATTVNVMWGGPGYTPVKGDYDGDGRTDLALYVGATGNWYILLSGANYTTSLTRTLGGPGYGASPLYP